MDKSTAVKKARLWWQTECAYCCKMRAILLWGLLMVLLFSYFGL